MERVCLGKLKRGKRPIVQHAPKSAREKKVFIMVLLQAGGRSLPFFRTHIESRSFRDTDKKEGRSKLFAQSVLKNGSDLLSHLRSTIGVNGLNFSVRNGKRWNPATIAT